MRVIYHVSPLLVSNGGPTRSVVALAERLSQDGDCDIEIFSIVPRVPGGDAIVAPRCDLMSTTIVKGRRAEWLGITTLAEFARIFEKSVAEVGETVVHDNGIWKPAHVLITEVCKKCGVPLVVSPRGMLQGWAMRQKYLKKRLAWLTYERGRLTAAAVLHAASKSELDSIRRLRLRQPVALVPNGIEMTAVAPLVDSVARPFPNTAGDDYSGGSQRVALFLGRINPSKGLVNLINAWAAVRPANWRLVIAGPDENGHQRQLLSLTAEKGLSASVSFAGLITSECKAAFYRSGSLFILPTYSENFGVAVVEALTYGLPVITTHGAPWSDLASFRCGWWVPPTLGGITSAVLEATELRPEELAAMGRRGAMYAQRFDIAATSKEMLGVYKWLCGAATLPGCMSF